MSGVIYKWTNNINGKCYIGKATNERHRKLEHMRNINKCKTPFYNALKKYGVDNFQYEVLHTASDIFIGQELKEHLNFWERFYIREYKSNDKNYGYNLTQGGDGGRIESLVGVKRSDEVKLKISKSNTGKKRTPEMIQANRERHLNTPQFVKDKISDSIKKLWIKDEYREHQSDVHKGHLHTPEQCNKISQALIGKKKSNTQNYKKPKYWLRGRSKKFINNGSVNKCVFEEDYDMYINNGWKKGRLKL